MSRRRRRWIGGRWIHRRGVVFDATLQAPSRNPAPGSTEHDRRALVRISSTFGWGRPLPDWVGMGARVFDGGDEAVGSGHFDLLLASSAPEPELWCQLRPNRDVLGCTFSSATRYPLDGVDQVVVAIPVDDRSATLTELVAGHVNAACPIHYRLEAAETRGSWRQLGELVLTHPRRDHVPLRFKPPREGPGFITPLRRIIYGWAQP